MSRNSRHARAGLLLLVTTPAFAETLPELDPVTVTAARSPQHVSQAMAATTVITREEIESAQAQSVPELLRGKAGIDLAANGGAGKTASVFVRGANSDQLLVLIDGIRVGSATTGTAAFEHIPVELIERIEIVRGPRSALYGAEAVGGVIQIFTRRGEGGLRPTLAAGAGSQRSYAASASLSAGDAANWVTFGTGTRATRGFNACHGKPSPRGAGCFTFEPDRDGYRNNAWHLNAGAQFTPQVSGELTASEAYGYNENDSTFTNESDTLLQVLGGRLQAQLNDAWSVTLAGGRSRDESDNFLNRRFVNYFNTERDSLSLQSDVRLARGHQLSLGVDHATERVQAITRYVRTGRADTGLFALYHGALGLHDVELSARRDDNEQFGYHTSGGAAWGWRFAEGWRSLLSWGTAFKAPTFNQLYFPNFGTATLQPERARNWEAGLTRSYAAGYTRASVFETKIANMIGVDAATNRALNIDKARLRGAELESRAVLDAWQLGATLTWLDPENQSDGANNGRVLNRRAQRLASLDVARRIGPVTLGANVQAAGHRFDDLANNNRMGGYATVDLRIEYALSAAWQIQARIANLFDKQYETAQWYPQPGRSAFVMLRWSPPLAATSTVTSTKEQP